MGFSAKILSITVPVATGSVSYTGAGFAPQALLCIATSLTADGSGAHAPFNIGVGAQPTGTPTQYSSASTAVDNAGGAAAAVAQSKALFIQLLNPNGGTTFAAASLTSLDADGFTLNWTNTADINHVIQVLCLGGSDLTNSNVNEKGVATSTGNSATTGVGFQPSLVMFLAQLLTTTEPLARALANATQFFGAAFSITNTFYTAGRHVDGVNPTVQRGAQKSTASIAGLSNTGWQVEGTFLQFDADGYTVNYTTVPASAFLYGFLCLKGIQAKIISFTSPGSTGNVGYTGAGFAPVAAIFSSDCGVSSTANTANCRRMLGLATSSSNRGVCSWASKDAVSGSSNASHDLDRTKCVKHIVEGHGSPTFPSVADLVSFDADGFTLNWTAADATARETFVLLLGPAAAAVTTRTPTVGALTASGVAASMMLNTILTPAVGALTASGVAASMMLNTLLTPSAGSLTIAGVAAVVVEIDLSFITPDIGALVFAGASPSLLLNMVRGPPAFDLAIASDAPTLVTTTFLTPSAGSLSVSGQTPSVLISTFIFLTPDSGVLVLASDSPTLQSSVFITPSAGALTLEGQTPEVEQQSPGDFVPSRGILDLVGTAPILVVTVFLTPGVGALSVDGQTGSIRGEEKISPGTGSLTLAGLAPVVHTTKIKILVFRFTVEFDSTHTFTVEFDSTHTYYVRMTREEV
jgi:hypothetical protein